jgi:phospho-N-acetylmuramoyl-pentapeptide-transferase
MEIALLLCGLTFAVALPWGGWLVRALLQRGIGKKIRSDGPADHAAKSGTATMGGLYFIAAVTGVAAGLAVVGLTRALLPLAAMLLFGLLGAFDDLRGLRDRNAVGWRFGNKFVTQWGMALVVGLILTLGAPTHPLVWPGRGQPLELGWWMWPLATVLVVACSNAVNLTDGLDGLAGGVSAIAFAAFGALALLEGDRGVGLFCFALVGALMAFLWYNVNPASVFMGDVGAEALGAALAAVALLSGHALLLPLIGVILVAEALSDIIQVGWFKFTRHKYGEGRRVFRMAPIHHHFELGGWSEVQVTQRFWLVGAAAALAGVALGMWWR